MISIRMHSEFFPMETEKRVGGGGRGTHILYVRYIILLQKGRQQSRDRRKESHRKKDEGVKRRAGSPSASQRQTQVGFTDTVDRI